MRASFQRLIPLLLAIAIAGCFDGDRGYRQLLPPDDGGPPVGGCAAITSCEACTPVRGCGWCTVGGAGRCARSPDECSPNGAFSWTWVPEGCPGAGDGGVARDGGASDAVAADGGVDVSSAPGSGGASFKSASNSDVNAAPGNTNLLSLTLAAPTTGSVWLSATGWCGVPMALPAAIVGKVGIEAVPLDLTSDGGATVIQLPGGMTGAVASFSVTRTLPARAGENSYYLNVMNPSASGLLRCASTLTAFFSAQPLP